MKEALKINTKDCLKIHFSILDIIKKYVYLHLINKFLTELNVKC